MERHAPVPAESSVPPAEAPGSPTFAELFAASRPTAKDHSRLLLALCGSMLVVAVSICGATLLDRVRLPNLAARSMEPSVNAPLDRDRALKDILEGQKKSVPWEPVPFSSGSQGQRGAAARPPPAGAPSRQRRPARGRPASAEEEARTTGQPVVEEGVDPAYAALWGSADRYAAVGRRAASEGPPPEPATRAARSSRDLGLVLPARLRDRVAGTPPRAPVIATLTRGATLGGTRLPAGAELHGRVAGAGAEEMRIYLDFDFARLGSGDIVPLHGVARDPRGRLGIPANRTLGRKAAGSVGLSSASRVARQVGRRVAGHVGDVLGAGLEGATDSATDKAQRVDPDEVVLVSEPGVSFAVYILEAD